MSFAGRSVLCLCLNGLLLPLCPPAAAQETPGALSHRPLKAQGIPPDARLPVIDGDLSDPIWQHAACATVFVDHQTGKPAPDQTTAWLLYDKSYIYVAFHCQDSQPEAIVARETVRDADMGNDDTVQILLDPFLTYQVNDFAVFALNPLGTRHTQLGGGRAGNWNGREIGVRRRGASPMAGRRRCASPGRSSPTRARAAQ